MNSRGLVIALFVSLAVNLFMIGAVVGGLVIAHRIQGEFPLMRRAGAPPQLPLWAAADALPPAHRDAYRMILRDQALGVSQQVRDARQARRRAWEGLTAEPFNAQAVDKDLTDARALEMQARGAVEQKIIGFAATLPPAERAQLAEGLARSAPNPRDMMRRMHGRGGRDGDQRP